jgi:hypothetical protein
MTPLTGTGAPSSVPVGMKMHDAWVEDINKATADDKPAIELTRQQLLNEEGVATTLVEMPDQRNIQVKWVICREF